ncbi:MAG: CBS domain-containing protein [Actinomycetota bacterium]|nr:CBS domain-containing protein [Actinomycetota bacterium]
MRASEIMTRWVATARPDTTVGQAAALLSKHRVTSLPVLDSDDRVIGIVSEGDLIRDRMPHDPRSHLRPEPHDQSDPARFVRDVMTDTVACMSETADTADLAALMLDNNIRAVPIVDGAHLVGIVSRRDLLRTLTRNDDAIEAEVTQLLADALATAQPSRVTVLDGVVTIHGHHADTPDCVNAIRLARTVPGVLRVHSAHGRAR